MAANMFLELKPKVQGESQHAAHVGQIEVTSWYFGGSRTADLSVGSGASAGAYKLGDVTITKYLDSATPVLLQHFAKATHFDEGKLTIYKGGGSAHLPYVTLEFKELVITRQETGGAGQDGRLDETLDFAFGSVHFVYTEQDDKGQKKGTHEGLVDVRNPEQM